MRFITDGPWDIQNFVTDQCKYSNMEVPAYFSDYINLRKLWKDFYRQKKTSKPNISRMLHDFDLSFEGREHSGLDDSRNIGRIVLKMMADGCMFEN